MVGALAALLLAATAPGPAAACGLTHLEGCRNTNQLVWSPSSAAAVRRFFGGAKGDYLYPSGGLADQAMQVLGGPPDDPKRLADGGWLFTACRARSCPEKGAVILTPQGRILAIGLLNFRCHRPSPKQVDCDKASHLDVFVRPGEMGAARLIEPLDAWARATTASDRGQFGAANVAAYAGAQVHDVRPSPRR